MRAFYLSLPTTLLMNIPFHAIHFSTYEHARQFLLPMFAGSAEDVDIETGINLVIYFGKCHCNAPACRSILANYTYFFWRGRRWIGSIVDDTA
jgi:hypothetical protein